MADISSLLSTLLSGGASSDAPAAPEAPAAPGAGFQALANSSPLTGSTVLARLRGGTGAGAAGGIGGIIGGGMGAVKPDSSKLGAFAQGFAGALKAGGEQESAKQKAQLELMKLQWDMDYKKQQLEETKAQHAALAKYYEGIVENGKKSNKDDEVGDRYKDALSRESTARRLGLHDKSLNDVATGKVYASDADKQAAKDELARRKGEYDAWEKKTFGDKASTANPSTPDTADATDTPDTPGDDGAPDTGNVPLPPARPPMFKVSPLESTAPATPATPAPTTTLRPVIGPDGQKHLFDPATGAMQPFTEGQGAAAVPGAPPPPGFTSPDDQIPGFSG